MDPNANLDEQLRLVEEIQAMQDAGGPSGEVEIGALTENAERLAELVEALDHWITGGGFLPSRWAERPNRKGK